MNRILGTICLVSAAAVLPLATHAQAARTPVSATLTAGAAMPMGDLDNFYNLGYGFGGGIEFAPSMLPFGMRGELGYTRFSAETVRGSDGAGGTFSIKPKSSNLSVTVNALLGPTVPAAQIRPYAIAGVGFYNTSEGGSFSGGGFSGSATESKGSLGFNGGAGVRFQFVGFSSFVEARYHHILKGEIEEGDPTDPNATTTWKSAAYLPIHFGISFGGR